MKIVGLQIYGYGQLENVKISNLTDFQVFYGENEAGKSTIMAFIHGILFGFPTKQQTELRYEPKHHTKYGGNIKIYHEEQGFAVIERVKGKAAGDVKVVLDNGTMGGEELLNELLENFDKGLYQAIFSFNLHGLQNIHQMKGEEIGRFLFSAGTLGTEKLAKTESLLQKELDSRFKPSGKKPLLNEKLQELHEMNAQLKKAAAQNKEYEQLTQKNEFLQQEMAGIHKLLREIQHQMDKLNEWKRMGSIIKEEKWIEKELDELGHIEFPARGIERFEKLNQLIHPYNAQISSMTDRIDNLKRELAVLEPDKSFLENEPALQTLLDQVPLYEQFNLEKRQCETKLTEYEEKLAAIKERLHLPIAEADILSINTNMYMKNQVERISRRKQKLEEVKEELEDRYQEERNLLQEIEKEVRFAEEVCLPRQERALLEKQVNHGHDKKNLEWELAAVKDKIEFYQQANEREKSEKERSAKQKKLQFFIFLLILLGLSLYGIQTKQWILLLLGIAVCIAMALFFEGGLKNPMGKKLDQLLEGLKEKEKQLIQTLNSAKFMDMAKLEEQLKLDNQRLEQLQKLKVKLEQQNRQYEKVIAKFEEWELEAAQNKEELLSISSQLKIPEYIAHSFLLEAFQLIEQYKTILREKGQIVARLEQISEQQNQILDGIRSYARRFLPEKGLDLHNMAYLLRNRLKEEQEKQIKRQERAAKLADFEAELKQKVLELHHLKQEYDKLLMAAKVESEQKFYELGEKAEKKEKLLEKLETIQSQLQYSILSDEDRERFFQIHNSEDLMDEYILQDQQLQAKLKTLQEEQASIRYEIQVLEEGGLYSDILHNFKQKKFELEEAAKEWSVYCLAQDILSKTIERYKNIHLPRMLTKAEEYLFFLTNGSYHKIHLQKSGAGFLVEREDHTLFEANELSQATTEQLYVAIRLALATTLYEKYQFPIIIDDSFVNFDAKRTEKIIELLTQLDGNQILFFTCHAHLLHHFKKENILSLGKGAVQITS